MKVQIINKGGYPFIVNMDKNTQLYRHFKLWELANNKGVTTKPQMLLTPEQDNLMLCIEALRDWWNRPMNCNSCYRQTVYNKSIGGASNSLHLLARAFDWGVDLSYKQRVAVYETWKSITKRGGFIGGINFYPWGVHLDANEDYYGHTDFIIRDGDIIVPYVPCT